MSVTIETIITCDGGRECLTDGSYADGDSRHETAAKQRANYGNDANSWVYYKGKDYCPGCAMRLGIKVRSDSVARRIAELASGGADS